MDLVWTCPREILEWEGGADDLGEVHGIIEHVRGHEVFDCCVSLWIKLAEMDHSMGIFVDCEDISCIQKLCNQGIVAFQRGDMQRYRDEEAEDHADLYPYAQSLRHRKCQLQSD
jgi:hypothetical protein